ncbi:MAG: ArnT family glycosyltransferase [Gammaproteobacteria bacterium]
MRYSYITGIGIVSLILFAFYFRLASYELLNINEGLYAEIAREMVVTRDYILPQLNFILYIEKPPLLYWLIASSFKVLGTDVFAARFVTASCGVLTCLALIGFGFKLNQIKLGYLAAIIVATSLGFQIIMRMVFFDPLLTVCLTIGLLSFYVWHEKSEILYVRIFYFFLGLAVLTKGFVGLVLPGGIVVFFMLAARTPWIKWRQFFDWIGIILFLAVVLPWHIMMALQHKDFLWRYLIEEQFLRFLHEREPQDYHTGPWYYYFPRILVYLFPWSCLLPLLFIKTPSPQPPYCKGKSLTLFLWLWFLVPLIFFSISIAKGDYYMVIGVPPLALLLAMRLEECRGRLLVLLLWILFLGGLYLAPHFIPLKHAVALTPLLPLWKAIFWIVLVVGIFSFLLSLPGSFRAKQFKRLRSLTMITKGGHLFLLGIIFFSLLYIFTSIKSQLQDNGSEITIGNYINSHLKGKMIYLYEDFEEFSTVLFYVRQRMPIINSKSADLAYGKQFAPKEWFLSTKEFNKIAMEKPIYIIILKDKISQLSKDFHVLSESTSTALMSNEVMPVKE